MLAGTISIDECEAALAQELDFLVYTAFRAGNHGDELSDADMLLVRQKITEQHEYLHDWFDELRTKRDARDTAVTAGVALASGIVAQSLTGLFSTASLLARAAMYARTAQAFVGIATTLALGMPILPFYPRDNSSRCLFNDACIWEIVAVGPNSWDCYWRVDPLAESCANCLKRGQMCNPLRIVDGSIVPFDMAGVYA